MVWAGLGAFKVLIPKLGLKEILRKRLDEDLVLGVEHMHVHLANDGDFETQSLMVAERAWRRFLLTKQEEAVRHLLQAINKEIVRQEMLDTVFWKSNPGVTISKRGGQEETEFLLGELLVLFVGGISTKGPGFGITLHCRLDGKNE